MTNSPVNDLADQLMAHLFEAEPVSATLNGVREYDDRLADLSLAAEQAHSHTRKQIRESAIALDPSILDEQDRITREVIICLTDIGDDTAVADALAYTATAFPVAPASSLLAYLRMTVLTSAAEARAYLARLQCIPRHLTQAESRLAMGRELGLLPVTHLVQSAIDQIDLFLAATPNPLAIAPPPDWSEVDEWINARDEVIDSVAMPAFAAHREVLLTEVLPSGRSTSHVGLVHLPDGLGRYQSLIRVHTTTDRTPEDLHDVGLRLMEGIHDEFRALGLEVFGLDDVQEIFARLGTDPALRWSSEQQILDAAEVAVRRAESLAPDWFGRLPEAPCVLDAIPELEADGAPAAYYMPPAIDGSRPGTYYTNVAQPTERTTFDLESVAFHEAVPGHHFQIALALETPGLPLLRRVTLFNAYAEGWGLYSERLADEMGLYSSQVQRMGMLSADAWRASRLVVDTGMHAFGWSREQAVAYLLANTPVAPIEVEAEIDRYISMPGQALGYMTGRLEIQRLRAEAEKRLAHRFDIAAFHDTVLGSGGLPLSVLTDLVEAWIEAY